MKRVVSASAGDGECIGFVKRSVGGRGCAALVARDVERVAYNTVE